MSAENQSCITVFLDDIDVVMSIGICGHERAADFKQTVRVSVKLYQNKARLAVGGIEDCLDYSKIHDFVAAWADRDHVDLVETLAAELTDKCLEDKRVDACRVRISKPDIYQDTDAVGIEIYRKREDQHDG